jgi:opacity protein-like surface antigen
MIGKFAPALTLLVLTIALGARGPAQTAPATQTPAPDATAPAAQQQPAAPPSAAPPPAVQPTAQQPDTSQEPASDESLGRKPKPRDYKKWTFNVGAGANIDSGTTKTWVRGGGFDATVGAARNANKYLGLRADFFYANLPLRDSTQELAGASGATNYALDFTLGPVINLPVTKNYGGYVLFGPGFYHRSGSLDDDTTEPGSGCSQFWRWWGACSGAAIPLSGNFVHSSVNEFGYNAGAGVTRKMPSGVELYVEYRFTHGSRNGVTTDVRPITIGVRW